MARTKELDGGRRVNMYLDTKTADGFENLSTLVKDTVNKSEGARLLVLFMDSLSTTELLKMVKRLKKLTKEKK